MRRSFRLAVAAVSFLGLGTSLAVANVASAAKPAPKYLVALGDSYAEGYQPGYTDNSETLHGYVNQIPALVKSKQALTVANFGCGGATSNSILNTVGCGALATNGMAYPTTTQAAAAVAFIRANPGKIGLITISIGGNDFDACISAADPVACVGSSMPVMQQNVTTLVGQLRAAAGANVPMIATTYPDVVLGAYVGAHPNTNLATQSVLAFSLIINPDLKAAYQTGNVSFLDVTAATGAYIPLTTTTKLKPYGTIPKAVANVCTLTWFCDKGDIHPKPAGYTLIAKMVGTEYLRILKSGSVTTTTVH